MTTTHHTTFTIERQYPATPQRVFDAWANPNSKQSWFACHDDWRSENYELDFRPGGHERVDSYPPNDPVAHRYVAQYYDIVPNERIVYAYEMYLGETRISVSLATVEFAEAGDGMTMKFTEQLVMLDEYYDPQGRIEGTEAGLDNLGRVLSVS
jgi:uncharacterized protein YndB with AHSA1/START domain